MLETWTRAPMTSEIGVNPGMLYILSKRVTASLTIHSCYQKDCPRSSPGKKKGNFDLGFWTRPSQDTQSAKCRHEGGGTTSLITFSCSLTLDWLNYGEISLNALRISHCFFVGQNSMQFLFYLPWPHPYFRKLSVCFFFFFFLHFDREQGNVKTLCKWN